MTQKVSLLDLQFGPADDPKLRRLADELRKLQTTINSLIQETGAVRAPGSAPALAMGAYDVAVVAGSPPTFVIRYNDGGTIRTGSITLS